METRASRKRKLLLKEAVEDKEDRIRNLPDGILHHILSFLPVKSIAQASVLSTRWKYLWATLPCLDFSELNMKEDGHERKRKATELIIKKVLARHHTNFNIKVFRFKGHLGLTCLRDCIRQLALHSVVELELDLCLYDDFGLPRCIFDCDSLTNLTLKAHWHYSLTCGRNSCLKLWSYNVTGTTGLRSLQALTLKSVHFMDSDSTALFTGSSFPVLKRLTLNRCRGLMTTHGLSIGCPQLEDLRIEGTMIIGLDISAGERLKNLLVQHSFSSRKNIENWLKIYAPKLESFCWKDNEIPEKYLVQSFPLLKTCCIITDCMSRPLISTNAIINFLSAVVSARYLCIRILHGEKIYSTIYLEGGLPFPFLNLTTLEVHTGLGKIDIPGIVCLLKNAPLLDTLKLEIIYHPSDYHEWGVTLLDDYDYTEEQFWESEAQALRSFLDHLKVLKINAFVSASRKSAIIATRFLLKHGNVLQEVTLSSGFRKWKEELINGFPHVQISIN